MSPEPSALSSDLAALKTLNDLSDCGYLSDEQNEQANDILRCHPDLWREFAQLHDWTRNEALNILSANTVQAKCIALGIEDTRQNLRSPEDSPIERIIQECIVTNHVENEHTGFKLYNLPEAQEGEPISRHRMMMRDRAYNRFVKSATLLMRMRTAQLDYALKLRKNRPNYYDRDDYLRVSQDVINRREDEVIIEEALNNAARWEEKSRRMEKQKEDFRAAKEKAKLIEAFANDAEPGNTNHGIVEFLKTHDVDVEGLDLLGTAQKVIEGKRGPTPPEPISYPIVEFLKTQDLDEEGSAILAVAQHLIDKKNGKKDEEVQVQAPEVQDSEEAVTLEADRSQLSVTSDEGGKPNMEWRNEVPGKLFELCPGGTEFPRLVSLQEAKESLSAASHASHASLASRASSDSNTSALHARNVYLTNLRMTQKRADSLATAADRATVVHDEPMPPELFEAKIQAARLRKDAVNQEGCQPSATSVEGCKPLLAKRNRVAKQPDSR